ncbi:MAG: L,D-transpeptidase family protein [Actinomycetota bacterium]
MGSANQDITPNKRPLWSRFPRPGRKTAIIAGVLFALLLLAGGGAAYATMEYSQRYAGRVLPGSEVAGMPIGGMTEEEALQAVEAAIRPQLNREIELTWKKRSWTVTPRELGARSNARRVVRAALAASNDTSFFEKMQMRLLGQGLAFDRKVAITYPRQGARGFVEGIASSLDQEPQDAAIDYSTGWVEITKAQPGRQVLVEKAHRALMSALRTGTEELTVPVKESKPEVTADEFDQILLVRIGENKLYLYEDGRITREWTVATGQPEYMTPTGLFEVTELRYLPTWVNPAPDTWGANMPESIPPGPNNPLGVRAINWSAPAIRFHGTSAEYSLGYNASHGCVRMSNSDVIELFDIVKVGTPIVSVIAGELKPMYASAPDPTPVAENSGDTAPTSSEADAQVEPRSDNRDGNGKKDD